jgi:hypothetical protein
VRFAANVGLRPQHRLHDADRLVGVSRSWPQATAGDDWIVEVPPWSDMRPRTTFGSCVPLDRVARRVRMRASSVRDEELARVRGE